MSPTEWCWSAIRCSAAGLLIVTAGLGTPMLYLFAYDSYDLRPARIFPHPRHAPAPPAAAGATATDSASPSVSAAAEEERCGAAWASGGSDPIDWIQADPSSNHFVDSHGRVRLFHGLNVVFKTPPHIPDPGEWEAETSFGPADAANLSAWGFNAIRLGVLWAGTYPARRDQLDSGYIDKVKRIVQLCAAAGVHVVLDMHSDVLSRRFCGNGMPDWAVDDALEASGMRPPYGDFPSPLPIPQSRFFGGERGETEGGGFGGGHVCLAPGVTGGAEQWGEGRSETDAAALQTPDGTRVPARQGQHSTGSAQSAAGQGAVTASAAITASITPAARSANRTAAPPAVSGWCAAELAGAAGARTSSQVAAALGAAGLYPNLDACLERDFFSYYYTNVSTKTTMALYTNLGGLRDAFSQHWSAVAASVASEPGVLAHDLLNEPWPGDTNDPQRYSVFLSWWFNSATEEHQLLLPFYRALAGEIRRVDAKHIIAYEPVMWDVWTSGFRGEGIEPQPGVLPTPPAVSTEPPDGTGRADDETGDGTGDETGDGIGRAPDETGGGAPRLVDGGEGGSGGLGVGGVGDSSGGGDGGGVGVGDGGSGGGGLSRLALSWHAYCWWAPNVTPRLSWLCAAYHRHLFAIQAYSARLQRGGTFLSEFGSLGSSPVEISEISRVASVADEFLVSRFYWQYKNYHDITSSGGYGSLSLYPRAGALAETKLRALATPYAQAVAGKPTLMRWDSWWRTLAVEYTAAPPPGIAAGDAAGGGCGVPDVARTTELHVAAELHYPEGYAVLASVLSPPFASVWRASHTARGAYAAALAWLHPPPPPPGPLGPIPAGGQPPSPPVSPTRMGEWEQWEVDASRRARPFASRVSSDQASRVWLTHPPAADGQSLLVCIVPCDAYHRRFCEGGGLGQPAAGGGGRPAGAEGGAEGGVGSGAGMGSGAGEGPGARAGAEGVGGMYNGNAAVWLAVWHPCVWRSEVQSLYVLLSLSTSALLVTTLLALAHLRARTHATPPSFDDLPLAYRLPLYLAALVQLAGSLAFTGCLYHDDLWRWLLFFLIGPAYLCLVSLATGVQAPMITAILGAEFVIWRGTWYLVFFAPGAESIPVFALYRCSIAVAAAALLVHLLIHLPKRSYYKMYAALSAPEPDWWDEYEEDQPGTGEQDAGATGYSGRRAIVGMALLLLCTVLGAGSAAGLAALGVLLVNPVSSALVPAVTGAGMLGCAAGLAVGGYAAWYTMFVSGVAAAEQQRSRRSGGLWSGADNKGHMARGYSALLW